MKAAEGTMDLIINTVSANHQAGVSKSFEVLCFVISQSQTHTGVHLPSFARLERKDNPTWTGYGTPRGTMCNSYDVTCRICALVIHATQEPLSASR